VRILSKERWILGYDICAERIWEPWSPSNFEILKDTIDIHIHAGSGRIDEYMLAKQATEAGMRAIVLKSWHSMSVDAARVADEAVQEWTAQRGLRPVKVFGGVVLNRPVGGLNPEVVRLALQFDAKEIWMPTSSAGAYLERKGMSKQEARTKGGIYILENGELVPEAREIVDLIADSDAALSCGHLSHEEILVLIEEAKNTGVKNVIVDHPHLGSVNAPLNVQKEMVKKGAYLNHTFITLMPLFGTLNPCEMAEDIKAVGAEHCIMSTDVGQIFSPTPVEAMRLFIQHMRVCKLSQREIDLMTKINPAKILGLEYQV